METKLVYIILNIFLLTVFVIVGNKVSKGSRFWGNAIWCVISFSLIQGLRYGRGTDYYHYSLQFVYRDVDTNPFFNTFNFLLESIGINRYSCFVIYAFFFVTCGMCFLKQYRKYAKYTFPCFLIGFMYFNEYVIRQAFSFSFVFLYLTCLFKWNLKFNYFVKHKVYLVLLILFAFLSISIHSANIITLFVFTFLYYFVRFPIHYYVTVPIYFLCVYILPSIFDFSYLQPLLNFVGDYNERALDYVSNSEKWFSLKGADNIYTRNVYVQVFEFVGTSSLFFLGYKTIKNKSTNCLAMSTMLNVFFIGVSIQSLFRNLEILNRIGHVLYYIGFIVLAIVLYYKPKIQRSELKFYYASLVWFLYDYLKYVFFPNPLFIKYIWDAPGNISIF